ncbi:MAG TPA: hypothetical protein VGO68_07305 [Pyrinomonadaceae bacterium]|jgi:hypothetical protein|nr:hypothetical protein [Pyrinomonadaceae bacterium]
MSSDEPINSPSAIVLVLFFLGLLLMVVGIMAVIQPNNFLTEHFPLLKTDHAALLAITGLSSSVLAAVIRYNALPVPTAFVAPPSPLNIQQNDSWRRQTSFRYLEKRKAEFFEIENEMMAAHKGAVDAHLKLSNSTGRVPYDIYRKIVNYNLKKIENLRVELEKTREEILRIASGDVRAEVLDLEEQIETQLRRRDEYESELRQAEVEMPTADKSRKRWLETRRESRHYLIYEVDKEVITLRSTLKELREFDFNKLYNELGVSPEAMRTTEAHLQSIGNKARLVTAIKPQLHQAQPPPPDAAKVQAEKQAAIQSELERLEMEKQKMMATISDDDMRRLIENMYNDKRAQVLEELRKAL